MQDREAEGEADRNSETEKQKNRRTTISAPMIDFPHISLPQNPPIMESTFSAFSTRKEKRKEKREKRKEKNAWIRSPLPSTNSSPLQRNRQSTK
jgi:hypothetical protein